MRLRFTDPVGGGAGTVNRLPGSSQRTFAQTPQRRPAVHHVHVHQRRRTSDAAMTPQVPVANPRQPRSGQDPFHDQKEAHCVFRRDRTGLWHGEDRDGKRWVAHENAGKLFLYPAESEEATALASGNQRAPTAGGGIVNPEDPRSADRRRAGDQALADPGGQRDGDHVEALRSWQAQINEFYRREG